VKSMPFMLRVNGQGRTVIPKEVRQALGIEGGSKLVCRIIGRKVILERLSVDRVQEAFSRLEDTAPSLDLDIVEVEGEDKYVDREYALRKIGLRRGS